MNAIRTMVALTLLTLCLAAPSLASADVTQSGRLVQTSPNETVSTMFQQGQADRRRWESWFAAQTGDYLAGATYGASQPSEAPSVVCRGPNSPSTSIGWTGGCVAAQQQLAMSEQLRKTQPEYRLGWNSIGAPTATALTNPATSESSTASDTPLPARAPESPQSDSRPPSPSGVRSTASPESTAPVSEPT